MALFISASVSTPSYVQAQEGSELRLDSVASTEARIIVNDDVPLSEISQEELEAIALGKTKRWSDGTKVKFILYGRKEVKNDFLRRYLGMSVHQYNRQTRKRAFSGSGATPKSLETAQEVASFVGNNRGAISFLSDSDPAFLDGAKPITVR